jgi:hypothetical protein
MKHWQTGREHYFSHAVITAESLFKTTGLVKGNTVAIMAVAFVDKEFSAIIRLK